MTVKKLTAKELHRNLKELELEKLTGRITFSLANVTVDIDTTDTVGITLQSWLKQYMIDNEIYFAEPRNTQEFPDFFLDNQSPYQHMLEVKAFNYDCTPAFDIANFESYCSSVKENPFRLDADYLIFGYLMDASGNISVKKIWLLKIWEIAGASDRYPLKTQVKRDMIYNIRPNTSFKAGKSGPFHNKVDFLKAIYGTLLKYKGKYFADDWKETLSKNYSNYYGESLSFDDKNKSSSSD